MENKVADTTCPSCRTAGSCAFHQDSRDYFRCPVCLLVFVPPHQYLTQQEEKAVYDLHENTLFDPGYRRFLSRLFIPISARLVPNSYGLDFGSGPAPTLSLMFEEAGHSMEIYDSFYTSDSRPLQLSYDFITASEVVEHLHHPLQELDRLWSLLKPNGSLGIMTKRVIDKVSFSTWHYKNDPTHICFFSLETFQWFADHWCAEMSVPEKDVVLFKKRA
ncbi:MAG: class I SAM-dependent methyltransferase [Sedimenticola sp.]